MHTLRRCTLVISGSLTRYCVLCAPRTTWNILWKP